MVRRLLEYIDDKEENIIEGLVEAGMDPINCTFDYDGYYHTPGQLIDKLRNDVDYAERDAQEWEEKYYRIKDERDQLKTRTVAKLLHEMNQLVTQSKEEAYAASRSMEKYKQENEELQNKINVWKILES